MPEPTQPTLEPGPLRDAYGFEVGKEYAELYNTYAPIWEQEEHDRVMKWNKFLTSFVTENEEHGGGKPHSDDIMRDVIEAADHEGETSGLRDKLGNLLNGGLPSELRGRGWKCFLGAHRRRKPGYYDALVHSALDEDASSKDGPNSNGLQSMVQDLRGTRSAPSSGAGDGPAADGSTGASQRVNRKLKVWKPNSRDWLTQIEKDLHRTFPGHPLMDMKGRSALRRILAAYSKHNASVGYCQGMNFIAGCLLLFMDEEDAFYCLTTIVEDILPGYYSMAMVAPQVDQRVFKRLVADQFPSLTSHLEALGVDVSCVFAQWFLCCFVNFLPLETCLRVWDVLFWERSSVVLFRVALALVEIYSAALLSTDDVLDACELLQSMAPMSFDSSRLLIVACVGFTHITDDLLTIFRKTYRVEVLKELEKVSSGRGSITDSQPPAVEDSSALLYTALSTVGSDASVLEPAIEAAVSQSSMPAPEAAAESMVEEVSSSEEQAPQKQLQEESPASAGSALQSDSTLAAAGTADGAQPATPVTDLLEEAGSESGSPSAGNAANAGAGGAAAPSKWRAWYTFASRTDKPTGGGSIGSAASGSAGGDSDGERSDSRPASPDVPQRSRFSVFLSGRTGSTPPPTSAAVPPPAPRELPEYNGKKLQYQKRLGKAASHAYQIASTPFQSPRGPQWDGPQPAGGSSGSPDGASQDDENLAGPGNAAGDGSELMMGWAGEVEGKDGWVELLPATAPTNGNSGNGSIAGASNGRSAERGPADSTPPEYLDSEVERAELVSEYSARYGVTDIVRHWRDFSQQYRASRQDSATATPPAGGGGAATLGLAGLRALTGADSVAGAGDESGSKPARYRLSGDGAVCSSAAASTAGVAPAGERRSGSPSGPPTTTSPSPGNSSADAGEASSLVVDLGHEGALDASLLAQLVSTVHALEGELRGAMAARGAAEAAAEHFNGVIELMAAKSEQLLAALGERDKMIGALTDKINKLLAEMALQDNEMADKEREIKDLRRQLDSLSPTPGWRHSSGTYKRAGGGAAAGGLFRDSDRDAYVAVPMELQGAGGAGTGQDGAADAGRWGKFFKNLKFKGDGGAAGGPAAASAAASSADVTGVLEVQ